MTAGSPTYRKIKKRTFYSAAYSDAQGKNVNVEFESSFSNAEVSKEIVSLIQEDGQWRITGYSIH